jgi:tetraacyldisaccharide 4'-kinase
MNLPRPLAVVFWPLSVMYGAAAKLRAWLYARGWIAQKRLKAPVVSIGNLTVGGTGKTPMVIWLAERFLAEGKRVAILSRGYGGTGGRSDEIDLMRDRLQGRVLFGVGKDRYAQGRRLEAHGVDVFILDDGFQHLPLARDADVVLVDSTRPLHKESVLPAGRLREPRAALDRAQLVVFTRCEPSDLTVRAIQKFPQSAIYPSTTKLLGFRRRNSGGRLGPVRGSLADPVFAFCAIGNPEAFFSDLERWGVTVLGRQAFRDHHRYTHMETARLERIARSAGAQAMITTEKDAQNIGEGMFLQIPLEVATIAVEIPDEAKFMGQLRAYLQMQGAGA